MSRQHRLVFATRNPGKVVELRELLAELDLGVEVVSLDDLEAEGISVPEVIEDGDTLAANAAKKAREVSRATALPALADDSGLEVDALGGAPGVHSARYAGPDVTYRDNNVKLVAALRDVADGERGARFRSCLALADVAGPLGADLLTAEGRCEGVILRQQRGEGGFGYDPLFYAPEIDATFAEIPVEVKNELSHRARAMAALKPLLVEYFRR